MSIIIDALPETVMLGDEEFEINTDFRVSILFQQLWQDRDLEVEHKIAETLALYYPEPVPDELKKEALRQAMWFFKAGKEEEKENKKADGESGNASGAIFSYDQDDDYIYAAFIEQYGIDLAEDDLHWWKFRALFKSLSDSCKISKIMSYRSTVITSDMPKSEQKFYRKMKLLYALPDNRTEEEKESEFAEMLGF